MFQKDSRKTVAFAGRGAATKRTCKQTNACLLKAKFAATREQVYPKTIITGMAPLVGLEAIEKFKKCLISACFCPILPHFQRKTKSCAKHVPKHTTSDSDLKNSRRLLTNRRLNSYSIFLFKVSSSLWGRHRYRPGVCIMARTRSEPS